MASLLQDRENLPGLLRLLRVLMSNPAVAARFVLYLSLYMLDCLRDGAHQQCCYYIPSKGL